MTAASTPPSMGEPPKTLTALMPTNIFRPKKAALPATASICAIGDAAHDGSIFKATFSSPVMRPQAMKAGMMGTKMAEIFFKASLAGVAFFFRMASRSSFPSPTDAAWAREAIVPSSDVGVALPCSRRALNSFVTLAALPGPRTICHSSPDLLTPKTPGIFLTSSAGIPPSLT